MPSSNPENSRLTRAISVPSRRAPKSSSSSTRAHAVHHLHPHALAAAKLERRSEIAAGCADRVAAAVQHLARVAEHARLRPVAKRHLARRRDQPHDHVRLRRAEGVAQRRRHRQQAAAGGEGFHYVTPRPHDQRSCA